MSEEIKWDEKGLVPVIVQDYQTKDVLMVAYMNKEAFDLTVETKKNALLFSFKENIMVQRGNIRPHTGSQKHLH